MCGACGNDLPKDWSWPWAAGSRSATLIARVAEQLSRVRGLRVLPAPKGWQIIMPTGATHLVQSLHALARVARVDSSIPSEMFLDDTGETPVPDRRRTIKIGVATPYEQPSGPSRSWPEALLRPETTVVTIDGSDSFGMLRELEEFAHTASRAPYRDHIRILPITTDITQWMVVHHWGNLPDRVGSGGLAVLCLCIAARLVALPEGDTDFREVLARWNEFGTVCIQSIGPTVIAMDVAKADSSD